MSRDSVLGGTVGGAPVEQAVPESEAAQLARAFWPGVDPQANPYAEPERPAEWTDAYVAAQEDVLEQIDFERSMYPGEDLSRDQLQAIEARLRAVAKARGVDPERYFAKLRRR